ncbi:hypothetical protein [Streptomyces sp. NPDC029526]|uniref:hypothetical protein n=1 Tax=Streptomyces sp. NPDC029526 TaxID=3155728 RepID=UPI003406C32F
MTLEKGNWQAIVFLPGTPAQGIDAPVSVTLLCVADGSTSPSSTTPPPDEGPSRSGA